MTETRRKGLLERLGNYLVSRSSPEDPRTPLSAPAQWLLDLVGGKVIATKRPITEQTSMQVSAVHACVRVIAETLGGLPWMLYKRLDPRGKERAIDHQVYDLLHEAPNDQMTPITFKETLGGHLSLWGNAYAEIEFNNAEEPIGLWPLLPDRTYPLRMQGELIYAVAIRRQDQPYDELKFLEKRRVLHIPGFGYDGLMGYSPIAMAKQAIGLAMATEEFGGRFFANGANLGGVLQHPAKLSPEAYARLQTSWGQRHEGLEAAHRFAILEEGLTWAKTGIPPDDAQFLESRNFQVKEIARIYRVPLHMIGDLEHATFSNIEHQSLEFIGGTMRPYIIRFEQGANARLLKPVERKTFFSEFLVDAVLRGDIKTRYEAYTLGRNGGWLSANDILELENMNPLKGKEGDLYLVPLNMVPAESIVQKLDLQKENPNLLTPGADPTQPGPGGKPDPNAPLPGGPSGGDGKAPARSLAESRSLQARSRIQQVYAPLFLEAAGRIVRREARAVHRAAKQYLIEDTHPHSGAFAEWAKRYYQDMPKEIVRDWMPALVTYATTVAGESLQEINQRATETLTPILQQLVKDYAEGMASRYVASSTEQLKELLAPGGAPAAQFLAVEERLKEWEARRPEKMAQREVVQLGGAMARAVYASNGFGAVWRTQKSESCGLCHAMEGRTVTGRDFFLTHGHTLAPEGVAPMELHFNVGHPPLHQGCTCLISAIGGNHVQA